MLPVVGAERNCRKIYDACQIALLEIAETVSYRHRLRNLFTGYYYRMVPALSLSRVEYSVLSRHLEALDVVPRQLMKTGALS